MTAAGTLLGGLSALLVLAGVTKVRRPRAARALVIAADLRGPVVIVAVLAGGEVAVGAAGMMLPGRTGGVLVAAMFAGLGAGAAVIRGRVADQPCGCFGDQDDRPLDLLHVIGCWLGAALATACAVAGAPGLVRTAAMDPSSAALMFTGAIVLAVAIIRFIGSDRRTIDAAAVNLVDTSARWLSPRVSRRSMLVRMAVAGSALAVAPLRYLLYPVQALAVIAPSSCTDGLCADGYTAFCCEINPGGVNGCPTGTFAGGWWMCTDYQGHQLCAGTGIRFYVDCNALPRSTFPGGCQCAGGACENRRVACNVFRYGQCNPQIEGTTPVVCRMVTCENPSLIAPLNCSSALMVDDAVCAQEAGCLQPPAIQLVGAGGA